MTRDRLICTHCFQPQRGSSGVHLVSGFHPLCHPDTGMDCYRLVTVYHHPLVNCPRCTSHDTCGWDAPHDGPGPEPFASLLRRTEPTEPRTT